jgi:hypothetical protein
MFDETIQYLLQIDLIKFNRLCQNGTRVPLAFALRGKRGHELHLVRGADELRGWRLLRSWLQ